MRDLVNVFAAIHGSLWAMPLEKMEAMVAFLDLRGEGIPLTAEEIRARIGDGRPARAAPKGSATRVIPVYGILSHRAHLVRNISGPGGTSTELLGQDFDDAMADDEVGTILFDIDSPGGNVAGVPELAAKISAARGQKRILAISNTTMASAAYWIGSAADEIIVTPSADVGAIGVYGIHTDVSRRDANAGITRTIIKAGRYKGEHTGYTPLSADTIAHEQRRIDEIYGQFLNAVAAHRGVSAEVVREKFGEGRTVSAQQAVALGMADRVATYDQILAELAGARSDQRSTTTRGHRAAQDDTHTHTTRLVEHADGTLVLEGVSVTRNAVNIPAATATQPSPASASHPQPIQASTAKERPVEQETTGASTNGAPATAEAFRLERERCQAIAQLAHAHNRTQQEIERWISAGASVDAVSSEILKSYGDGIRPLRVTVGADREALKPFATLGEQLQAIYRVGPQGQNIDKRLLEVSAGPSGANISDNASGGFLIQPQFSSELMKKVFDRSPIPGRCSRTPLGQGTDRLIVNYVEEDSRATGSRWGGVRVYRRHEADTVTASKIKFGQWECKADSLMGKAFVTNEALEDAPSLQSVYEEGFTQEFDFKLSDEIIRGTGAGECLGVLNSLALVTIAKETGQAADTVVAANIIKMWAACWSRSRSTSAWFINQEVEPQLQQMTLGTGTLNLVYMPPGGLSAAPYGTLMGRPVIPVEQASALGDVGDIILADFDQYKLVDKDGVRSDVSIHVRFEYNESCFLWTMRIGGQPKWKKPLTPYKGAQTTSPFVTLAERA